MTQAVTVYLPDEMLERYRRGAAVSRMDLDAFIAERLVETAPPLADDSPDVVRAELRSLEEGDEQALRQAAECRLTDEEQEQYDRLLAKQAEGSLDSEETQKLHELGEGARRLTLRKAHALMLLKWRGHEVPSREDLQGSGESG